MWEGGSARQEAQRFCDLWSIEGTVLLDEDGAFVDRVGVRGVPTNILVDSDGTVVEVGATAPDELARAVALLLGDSADIDAVTAGDGWHWGAAAEHIERHVMSPSREERGRQRGAGAPRRSEAGGGDQDDPA